CGAGVGGAGARSSKPSYLPRSAEKRARSNAWLASNASVAPTHPVMVPGHLVPADFRGTWAESWLRLRALPNLTPQRRPCGGEKRAKRHEGDDQRAKRHESEYSGSHVAAGHSERQRA